MAITTEQYKALQRFERHLLTAYKANYVTAIYKATAEELTRIYNQIFHTTKKPTNCGKCVLDMCKRLAPLYFAFQEQATQENTQDAEGRELKGVYTETTATGNETSEVDKEPTAKEKQPAKGKRGRKPKKTNNPEVK